MGNKFQNFAEEDLQPKSFKFNNENIKKANEFIKIYPQNYKESSIMPLLTLAQTQCGGWLPKKAIEYIANFLGVSEMKVLELATFYSMYNLSPIGKTHIEVCTTTPCMLRGSDNIVKLCKNKLNLNVGESTEDGLFSLIEVECLGACVNAPVAKIGDHYYEDLNEENFDKIIENIKNNKKLNKGSQILRKGSEPYKGKPIKIYNGRT